jgi:hypothetical protein
MTDTATPRTADARAILDAAVTEQELQTLVIDAANRAGWIVHHQLVPYRRDKSGKVRAIVEPGTTPGFPDLVLVHTERRDVLFVELKKQDGVLSPRQREWQSALQAAGARWYCWRPSDFALVCRVLGLEGA